MMTSNAQKHDKYMNLVPQNEKRKMLMEHETSKLKDLDEEYATELREWKAQLKPRKQVTTTRRSKISWVMVNVQ